MGLEEQAFWGKIEEERCVFFVGVSRAKERLILTVAKERQKPLDYTGKWDIQRTPQQEFINYAKISLGDR